MTTGRPGSGARPAGPRAPSLSPGPSSIKVWTYRPAEGRLVGEVLAARYTLQHKS